MLLPHQVREHPICYALKSNKVKTSKGKRMKKKWPQKLYVQTHLVSTEITLIVGLHLRIRHGNVLLDKVKPHHRVPCLLDPLVEPHRNLLLGVLWVGDGDDCWGFLSQFSISEQRVV